MQETGSRSEATERLVKFARFAVLATLILATALLLVDLLLIVGSTRGTNLAESRYLTAEIIKTFVYGVAIEVVAAIAGVLLLESRMRPRSAEARSRASTSGD